MGFFDKKTTTKTTDQSTTSADYRSAGAGSNIGGNVTIGQGSNVGDIISTDYGAIESAAQTTRAAMDAALASQANAFIFSEGVIDSATSVANNAITASADATARGMALSDKAFNVSAEMAARSQLASENMLVTSLNSNLASAANAYVFGEAALEAVRSTTASATGAISGAMAQVADVQKHANTSDNTEQIKYLAIAGAVVAAAFIFTGGK